MCDPCLYFVQFPGVELTDTDVFVNYATYPSGASVQDLVDKNPQFWLAPGLSGVNTVWTFIKNSGIDIKMTVTRGGSTVVTSGAFIKGRPDDR